MSNFSFFSRTEDNWVIPSDPVDQNVGTRADTLEKSDSDTQPKEEIVALICAVKALSPPILYIDTAATGIA